MSIVSHFVCKWLRWRHGDVSALKPPLGWSAMFPASPLHKALYWLYYYPVYRAELVLFNHFGKPLRDAWLRHFNHEED